MRMLLGMISPTSGNFSLFKNKYSRDQVYRKVGYMIESTYAYPDLSVCEYLELFYHYYGLENRKVIAEIIVRLSLNRYRDTKVKYLSLGNLQRLGLAKALMHNPELLILDEPANGLDPAGMVEIRQMLMNLAHQGTTIFLSSHLLGEIAKIADRIGIIHDGKMVNEFETNSLDRHLDQKLIIDTCDNHRAVEVLHRIGIEPVWNAAGELEIFGQDRIHAPDFIASQIVNHGIGLNRMVPIKEELESLFLRIIQSEIHD